MRVCGRRAGLRPQPVAGSHTSTGSLKSGLQKAKGNGEKPLSKGIILYFCAHCIRTENGHRDAPILSDLQQVQVGAVLPPSPRREDAAPGGREHTGCARKGLPTCPWAMLLRPAAMLPLPQGHYAAAGARPGSCPGKHTALRAGAAALVPASARPLAVHPLSLPGPVSLLGSGHDRAPLSNSCPTTSRSLRTLHGGHQREFPAQKQQNEITEAATEQRKWPPSPAQGAL